MIFESVLTRAWPPSVFPSHAAKSTTAALNFRPCFLGRGWKRTVRRAVGRLTRRQRGRSERKRGKDRGELVKKEEKKGGGGIKWKEWKKKTFEAGCKEWKEKVRKGEGLGFGRQKERTRWRDTLKSFRYWILRRWASEDSGKKNHEDPTVSIRKKGRMTFLLTGSSSDLSSAGPDNIYDI